jgi:hypothetical protein
MLPIPPRIVLYPHCIVVEEEVGTLHPLIGEKPKKL